MSIKQRIIAAMKAFAEPESILAGREVIKQIHTISNEIAAAKMIGHVNLVPIDNAYKKAPSRADRVLHYINQALDAGQLKTGQILEIGAREDPRSRHFTAFEYTSLDLIKTGPDVLVGDITNCPHIPDNSFDFILGHVDKWRSQRRIDVISMKPKKLSAVLS